MKPVEKKLLQTYRILDDDDKKALIRFAEFLSQKEQERAETIEEPKYIEPKEGETVVGALKRLSSSYFMLDKAVMLNETSTIMAQHIMQGKDKKEVVEELEVLFKTHYAKIKNKNPND